MGFSDKPCLNWNSYPIGPLFDKTETDTNYS